MTPSPSVTWPSPAMTTVPLRRTLRTVVDRIRRFVGMRANLDYNSADHVGTAALGCPVERSSTALCRLRSVGQPRAGILRRYTGGGDARSRASGADPEI